jgi:hypothetical protein
MCNNNFYGDAKNACLSPSSTARVVSYCTAFFESESVGQCVLFQTAVCAVEARLYPAAVAETTFGCDAYTSAQQSACICPSCPTPPNPGETEIIDIPELHDDQGNPFYACDALDCVGNCATGDHLAQCNDCSQQCSNDVEAGVPDCNSANDACRDGCTTCPTVAFSEPDAECVACQTQCDSQKHDCLLSLALQQCSCQKGCAKSCSNCHSGTSIITSSSGFQRRNLLIDSLISKNLTLS